MSKPNHRRKGLNRDRQIVRIIEECKALDTDQIWALFFSDIRYGRRKAQERLLKLYKRGRLRRCRQGEGPYIYYVDEKPKQLEHLLGVNWARVWIQIQLKTWERLHSWTYEPKMGRIRPDSLAAVKNVVTGSFRFAFIELDRSNNDFDKVPKYCKFFENGEYQGRWWVKFTDRFPPIIVVTNRVQAVRNRIVEENSAGLEWRVLTLDQIKMEVMERCV